METQTEVQIEEEVNSEIDLVLQEIEKKNETFEELIAQELLLDDMIECNIDEIIERKNAIKNLTEDLLE